MRAPPLPQVASLQPPPDDAEIRRQIIHKLEQHAQTVARGARLRLYGSSSCGLNAAGADLDLTLEMARPTPHAEQV